MGGRHGVALGRVAPTTQTSHPKSGPGVSVERIKIAEAYEMGQRAKKNRRELFTNPFVGDQAIAWRRGWNGEPSLSPRWPRRTPKGRFR